MNQTRAVPAIVPSRRADGRDELLLVVAPLRPTDLAASFAGAKLESPRMHTEGESRRHDVR